MISAPSFSATDVLIVLGNAPDLLLAKRIAHILVEDRLAACVNLGASGLSMYMWQGELEGSDEIPLTMKTSGARVDALIRRYTELHPHDVPEVLILPALGGTRNYLNWVVQQTTPE